MADGASIVEVEKTRTPKEYRAFVKNNGFNRYLTRIEDRGVARYYAKKSIDDSSVIFVCEVDTGKEDSHCYRMYCQGRLSGLVGNDGVVSLSIFLASMNLWRHVNEEIKRVRGKVRVTKKQKELSEIERVRGKVRVTKKQKELSEIERVIDGFSYSNIAKRKVEQTA